MNRLIENILIFCFTVAVAFITAFVLFFIRIAIGLWNVLIGLYYDLWSLPDALWKDHLRMQQDQDKRAAEAPKP